MEAIVPPKRRLIKYLHGATSQKTAFFKLQRVSFRCVALKYRNSESYHIRNFKGILTDWSLNQQVVGTLWNIGLLKRSVPLCIAGKVTPVQRYDAALCGISLLIFLI
jgi:hypothetical protein